MSLMRTITLLFAATAAFAAEVVKTPLDNDQVKVMNVIVQPHEKTRLHLHKLNRVMIYLTPGSQEIDFKDTGKTVLTFKAGDPKWSPAGGMHIAEVTSANPVNVVEVELKKPGSGAKAGASPLDPVKIDPKHYQVDFENEQVRVLHARFGPHEMAPMHEHSLNRVVVYLADQNFRITSADGVVEMAHHKRGEVSWGVPTKHKEENLNDKPLELAVVEFK